MSAPFQYDNAPTPDRAQIAGFIDALAYLQHEALQYGLPELREPTQKAIDILAEHLARY